MATADELAQSLEKWKAEQHTTYLDHRRHLVESQNDQSRTFDRTALTISSGALALSITFLHDIVCVQPPRLEYALWSSWFALVVGILSTLTSFHLSVYAYRRAREILDAQREFELEQTKTEACTSNLCARLVHVSNWISHCSIFAGIALMTIFAAANAFQGTCP